ncbi:hypothetical protein BN1708_019106, partial [Verticillium longisporum]
VQEAFPEGHPKPHGHRYGAHVPPEFHRRQHHHLLRPPHLRDARRVRYLAAPVLDRLLRHCQDARHDLLYLLRRRKGRTSQGPHLGCRARLHSHVVHWRLRHEGRSRWCCCRRCRQPRCLGLPRHGLRLCQRLHYLRHMAGHHLDLLFRDLPPRH